MAVLLGDKAPHQSNLAKLIEGNRFERVFGTAQEAVDIIDAALPRDVHEDLHHRRGDVRVLTQAEKHGVAIRDFEHVDALAQESQCDERLTISTRRRGFSFDRFQ